MMPGIEIDQFILTGCDDRFYDLSIRLKRVVPLNDPNCNDLKSRCKWIVIVGKCVLITKTGNEKYNPCYTDFIDDYDKECLFDDADEAQKVAMKYAEKYELAQSGPTVPVYPDLFKELQK